MIYGPYSIKFLALLSVLTLIWHNPLKIEKKYLSSKVCLSMSQIIEIKIQNCKESCYQFPRTFLFLFNLTMAFRPKHVVEIMPDSIIVV